MVLLEAGKLLCLRKDEKAQRCTSFAEGKGEYREPGLEHFPSGK